MATGTYSVRAAATIARRGETHFRRRAGLVFGENETIVSTDPGEEGAVHVTEEQLDAILHDSNLRDPEATDPSTPGLRAKNLAPEEEEGGPQAGEPDQGGAKASKPRKSVARRKGAKRA